MRDERFAAQDESITASMDSTNSIQRPIPKSEFSYWCTNR